MTKFRWINRAPEDKEYEKRTFFGTKVDVYKSYFRSILQYQDEDGKWISVPTVEDAEQWKDANAQLPKDWTRL